MTELVVDPTLDLVLQRNLDLAPADVWRAWTTPDLLKRWFCPRPWRLVECAIDPRSGGLFRTTMQGPEGDPMPTEIGCILEPISERRLSYTNALLPGFRPKEITAGFALTVSLDLIPHEGATKYVAVAKHRTEADRAAHESMGFARGWDAALDQMIEAMG